MPSLPTVFFFDVQHKNTVLRLAVSYFGAQKSRTCVRVGLKRRGLATRVPWYVFTYCHRQPSSLAVFCLYNCCNSCSNSSSLIPSHLAMSAERHRISRLCIRNGSGNSPDFRHRQSASRVVRNTCTSSFVVSSICSLVLWYILCDAI